MSYVEKNMKRIIGKKSKLDSSKVKIKEGPIQKKSKHIIPSQNKGKHKIVLPWVRKSSSVELFCLRKFTPHCFQDAVATIFVK